MKIPNCVGIIMDGNRRWAKSKGKLSLQGHAAGGETLKKAVDWAKEIGIKHIIFYTFSTENWNRSSEEVTYLLDLIGEYINSELENFNAKGGVLRCVGDLSKFSPKLQKSLKDAEIKTANNTGPCVYFALNYGGRQEILSAVKKIVEKNPKVEDITAEYFEKHLQTYPMPDPDLIIRTSGEMRLSGFLPWQGVYSELFFTQTLWPDFSKEEFEKIIEEYGDRDRRIGK
ncbi:di-trans,poly-cis-decaprenylcistransferase [Patescibacteria group bacterium]|nr:di-trans,poly-cis-decaprenylcistransferase [Patescibacteria group bacterium]